MAFSDSLIDDLPQDATQRRIALEELAEKHPEWMQNLDPHLLKAREEEVAHHELPNTIAGLRRTRLLMQDPISTTWECWELSTGYRVAIRLLRPSWRRDPVLRRRLARGARLATGLPHIAAVSWQQDSEWPHLRVQLRGPSLSDLLPAEDPPDTIQLAGYLARGLLGLSSLHSRGLHHGAVSASHLIHGPEGPQLAWFDPSLRDGGSPGNDIAHLGAAVCQLDPLEEDPIGDLARGFAESPPPNVEMATSMLLRCLASLLVETRHRLLLRSRQVHVRDGEARLLRAVSRLAQTISPPIGKVCVRAGLDALMVVAQSNGVQVEGGPVAGLPARHLPVIWTPENGLDAAASRFVLRAFATRTGGDEERRAQIQKELGGTDILASQLCRWLSAQSRLRATRRLLEISQR